MTSLHTFSRSPRGPVLALLACAALLGGCATPTTHEAMVPTGFTAVKKHPQTVSVQVSGGKPTESTGKPQISDDTFAQALVQAIEQSQTFSKALQAPGGNYRLSVVIAGIEQPSFGLSFTVKMEAGWTLKRADTGATVWQESIQSEHTVSATEAFAGVTRLRMATEGAARNNIAKGLGKISELSL